MGVVLNNSPMVTDNVTDDILVKSSDGTINKTSKASIIADAATQDLQSVMDNGSTANVNTDIEIKRSGDEPSTITLNDGLADVTVGENKITVRDDGTSNIRMTHGAEETLSELILMDGLLTSQTGTNTFTLSEEIAEFASPVDIQPSEAPTHAVQRQEVEAIVGDYVPLSGTTEEAPFTGNLVVPFEDGEQHGFKSGSSVFFGIGYNGSPVMISGDTSIETGDGAGVGLTSGSVYTASLKTSNLTTNKSFEFPNASGTIALVEDIEGYVPLSGTTPGNPITGDVEVSFAKIITQSTDGSLDGSLKLEDGSAYLNSKNTISGYNTAIVPISGDGITTVSRILMVTDDVNSRGLGGNSDYTANITDLDYTQKKYVDDADDLKANLSGAIFTGDVEVLTTPTNANSATSKSYVDNLITGLSWKFSVKASTVTALPSYTVSGSNTILTATANGVLTLDGVTLVVNDRVIVKNETTTNRVNNGIYSVTQVGSAGTPYILTRTQDADTSSELEAATVYVREGSTELNRIYAVNVSPITLGTTQITFSLINGGGTYTNGSGLTLTGNVFAIDPTYTTARESYADAKVSDAIADGVTTIAPSQNAVFDALATKQNVSTFSADVSNAMWTLSATTSTVQINSSAVLNTNLKRLQNQINAMNSYSAKTASYTLTDTDYCVDLTANSATFTLPTAVGASGKQYVVKNSGSGTTLTLATTSSQTIDGTTTKTFNTQFSGCRVISDGANWKVIGIF